MVFEVPELVSTDLTKPDYPRQVGTRYSFEFYYPSTISRLVSSLAGSFVINALTPKALARFIQRGSSTVQTVTGIDGGLGGTHQAAGDEGAVDRELVGAVSPGEFDEVSAAFENVSDLGFEKGGGLDGW